MLTFKQRKNKHVNKQNILMNLFKKAVFTVKSEKYKREKSSD